MDETKIIFSTESESASPESPRWAIEADLFALFTPGQPNAEFANRLEAELLERAATLRSSSLKTRKPQWRLNLTMKPLLAAALILVLLMLAVITAVGPQRVLAAMQNLLGYVPGIGFVDMEGARMLASPVSMTRDGVTLELEQVVASSDGTTVAFNLRSAESLSPNDARSDEDQDLLSGFSPTLILPDGERITMSSMNFGGSGCCWRGLIHFPHIPQDVNQAWLEVKLARDRSAGTEAQPWKVPFYLHDAGEARNTDEAVEMIIPEDARTTVNGVTVELLQVARATSETAVQLQVSWEQAGWTYWSDAFTLLRDDAGHTYYELPPGETSAGSGEIVIEEVGEVIELRGGQPSLSAPQTPSTSLETHVFPPLSAAARKITMVMNELGFSVPADASFSIDFGENPQPGQVFEVNQIIQVAGQNVFIPSARLIENNLPLEDEARANPYLLEILFSPEDEPEQMLISLQVESETEGNLFSMGSIRSWGQPLFASFEINEMPVGVIDFRVTRAEINLKGPWEIPLELPVEASGTSKSQRIRPGVSQTVNGVTIAIEEVTLTDRVTRVKIALPDLPEGADLISTFSWFSADQPFIEDSAGNRLDYPRAITWTVPSGFDPNEILFASLGSLPGRDGRFEQSGGLSLTIPSVTIFYPGKATLEVEVPSNVEFHPEKVVEKSIDGESHEFTRWLSDPWDIDLPIEIAGHTLRFTQARLELEANRIPQGYRLELSAKPPAESSEKPRLISLHTARIEHPDGEVQVIEYSLPEAMFSDLAESYIGPQEPGSQEWVAYLRIDVTEADGFGYLSGKYTIDLDGAAVLVPGPWQLTW